MSEDKENPLRKYMLKHSRAYHFRTQDHFPNEDLRIEYHRGYVRLSHPSQGEFYITRNAWIRLLKHALPVVKHMDEQFSVPRATRRYLAAEKAHDRALRAQKKAAHARQLAERRAKKRRRRQRP